MHIYSPFYFFLFGICFTTSCCTFAQEIPSAITPTDTSNSLRKDIFYVGTSTAYFNYSEPKFMSLTGAAVGVKASTQRFVDHDHFYIVSLDTRYQPYDYESTKTGTIKDLACYMNEAGVYYGKAHKTRKGLKCNGYFGLLYSSFHDSSMKGRVSSTGHSGYQRNIVKYFFTSGLQVRDLQVSEKYPNVSLDLDLETSSLLSGVVSCLGMKFDQSKGLRCEAGARLNMNKRNNKHQPYIRAFVRGEHTDISSIALHSACVINSEGEEESISIIFREPENIYFFAGIETGITF